MQLVFPSLSPLFFFFNDPATTEIYTLSLHDALPIFVVEDVLLLVSQVLEALEGIVQRVLAQFVAQRLQLLDRKSTRLNSSHQIISYAVFCLKKKKIEINFDNLQRTKLERYLYGASGK